MKIDQQTIDKYAEGINNPNTKKTYRHKLKMFIEYLEKNSINDVNQETYKQYP